MRIKLLLAVLCFFVLQGSLWMNVDVPVTLDMEITQSSCGLFDTERSGCVQSTDLDKTWCPLMIDGGTANCSISMGQYDHSAGTESVEADIGDSKADDSHNYGMMDQCESGGKLFMCYGAHHTQLFCRTSTNASDMTAWEAEESTALGSDSAYATYPEVVCLSDNEKYVTWRGAKSGGGNQYQRYIVITKWNGSSWTQEDLVNWGNSDDPYISGDPRSYAVNSYRDGKIHYAFTVRENDTSDKGDFNHIVYFYYDTTDGKIYNAAGTELTKTIDYVTSNLDFVAQGTYYFRSDVAADSNGRPYVLYQYQTTGADWWNNADLFIAWWDGATWQTHEIVDSPTWKSTSGRMSITHDDKIMVFTEVTGAGNDLYVADTSDPTTWTLYYDSTGQRPQAVEYPKASMDYTYVYKPDGTDDGYFASIDPRELKE